ncbi:hypothetical protein [Roseimaritima sediminicola]|uniref:hypothetical protein n=1 Tax=Roseimaritima sediminicola TaxID=2662066 RepID=UPI00129831FC|nr:hypothetical protein [Roseimaritima sediminicola]
MDPDTADPDTAELVRLVDERWQTLQTLLEMTLQQSELIQQQQVAELLPSLSRKQPLLEQFARLQEQLRPLAQRPADAWHWPDPAQRAACQQKLDESEQMLAEMMRLEQQCETELVASRDQLAQRMQQSDGSQRAASAYRQIQQPVPTSRLDLSSST